MDGVQTLHSKPNGKGGGAIPMPDGTLSQAERRMSKTSTNMPVTEKETKSLLDQNAKYLTILLGLLVLLGTIATGVYKFATYEFKISSLEKQVEALEKKEAERVEKEKIKDIKDAEIRGYQIKLGDKENQK